MGEKLAVTWDFLNSIAVDEWSASTEGSRVLLRVNITVNSCNRRQLILFVETFKVDLSEFHISGTSQILTQDSSLPCLVNGAPVELVVKFKVGSWIFREITEAKAYYANANNKSSSWLVLDPLELVSIQGQNSPEWESFLTSYHIAELALLDLTKLSHHKTEDEAIFVDSSESLGPSLVLSSDMSAIYKHDTDVLKGVVPATFLSSLGDSVSARQGDYLKEWAVLRASLIEFFKGVPERKCPLRSSSYLLSHLADFQDIFLKNLQAYVSGLSLEKLRTELANEQLKLSEKASSGLMDISGKMLMLPVAVGVGRFLPGVGAIPGSILIAITCIILLASLMVQKKQLNNIKSSNKIAFEDFDNKLLHEGNESIRKELKNIRSNLDQTVTTVQRSLWVYITTCTLPLIYSIFRVAYASKAPPETVSQAMSYFDLLSSIAFV